MTPASLAAAEHRAEVAEGYAAGQSTAQLATRYGVTRQAVRGMLRRQGVEARPNPNAKLSAAQKTDVVDRYQAGQGASKIAAWFEVSETAVRLLLLRRGVTLRVHTLWHGAFDELSPDAAYWIGFLFADGNVHFRPGYAPSVGLMLAARDREHLVKLRTFLGSSHAISAVTSFDGRTEHPACQFSVRSHQLADRLLSLGRYAGPVGSDLAASRHFWRGVVDGNGSVGSYLVKPTSASRRPQIRLVGSERLLEAFNGFLISSGITGLAVHPHKSIYSIGTSSRPAVRIIALLYRDAPTALTRKAAIAQAILACFPDLEGARRAA